jgi:DNA-binding transcriptional LysR family regulator
MADGDRAVAMNLNRLQTFATVVRLGTFAAAADALSFTPSAVSQQMSKLEAELGVPLLLRGPSGPGKRVEPTEAGRRLYAHATVISAAVLDACDELAVLRGGRHDRLRVGAVPAVAAALLPRALRRLRARLPALRAEVVEGAVAEDLCRRGLDVVLCSRDDAGGALSDPDLVAAPVARGPLLLALPAGHPLAELDVIPATALAGAPLLGCRALPCVAAVVAACEAAGAPPAPAGWEVAHPLALLALVRAGEGIAVVAPSVPADGVELRPLDAGPRWELLALRRRERPALAGMALADELRAVAGAHERLRPAAAVAVPLAA